MENPTLTIRIPKDLKEAIAVAAEADDRTITSFVVKALYAALALGPSGMAEASVDGKRIATTRRKS